MNWEKIKKIVIWILVGLNVMLFGLNYKKDQKYLLSAEREKAIYSVLAKNNIGIYTELKGRFEPMRQISVEIPRFSRDGIAEMFFSGEEVEFSAEDDWTVIMGQSGQVMYRDNEISFVSNEGSGYIEEFSEEKAMEASEKFISEKASVFKNIELDSIEKSNDGFICKYIGSYKDNRIFCMDLSICVRKEGVMWAEGSIFDIQGYYGISSEICAHDEALMTLIHSLDKEGPTNFITEVSIGYDLQDSRDISGSFKLIPCYYIYIQGRNMPVVINAYTNEIKM